MIFFNMPLLIFFFLPLLFLHQSSASISAAASRCGNPDPPLASVRRFAYFPGQPRWNRPPPIHLTYALSPRDTIDYIDRPSIESALRRSFARWAEVIPITFSRSRTYAAADVKVGFFVGDHGDNQPFDGVLGVLAHAFSPESGQLHLDASERWAVDFGSEESKVAVDLESVLTHEIGHVLGLAHSMEKEAVMFPSLNPRTKKFDLRVDDVKGVQALYGSNPDFTFNSLSESETSAAAAAKGRGNGGLDGRIRSLITGFCLFLVLIIWIR